MRNDGFNRLDTLSVEQTETLLAAFDALPLPPGAARRIRRQVQKTASPKRLRRKTAMRILTPLAACLVALALVALCFPQAAKAIADFLGLPYTPSRYMQQQPEEREAVATVDEALAAAAPQDGSYTITLLPEWEDAAKFVQYRADHGYAPFREEDWAWLRDIRPVIGELLYDGETLIWNTQLHMDTAGVNKFMANWHPTDANGNPVQQSADAAVDSVSYTVDGDPTVYELHPSSSGIQPIMDDEARSSAAYVVLNTQMAWADGERPPDGIITVTQHIFIYENDSMEHGLLVARISHAFTFDTTAGNREAAEPATLLVPLSGDCPLTLWDRTAQNETVATRTVSLDGVSLQVELHYLATGIRVHMTIAETPPDWTEAMKLGLLQYTLRDISGEVTTWGIYADLYVDGQFVSEAPTPDSRNFDELAYVLPVFPDGYQSGGEVMLKLYYASQSTLNGTDQLAGEVYTLPEKHGVELSGTTKSMPLAEIKIPLP